MKDLEEKILLSITGCEDGHYERKIEEIENRNIDTVALFLERFIPEQRKKIYERLKQSSIKRIPLVHIRDDMDKSELTFLYSRYGSKYFTIHENHFNTLHKWKGFEKRLFLEMNTDNEVSENVKVENIGGFCVDLAHFQKQKDRKTVDYDYVYERRDSKDLFRCNHLSGYSFEEMTDLHYVNSEKDFEYLKELPPFVFGDTIGIEIDNSIEEQIYFRDYIFSLIKENDFYIS